MTSVSGTHSNEHLMCSNFTVAEHNISILIFFKEGLFFLTSTITSFARK